MVEMTSDSQDEEGAQLDSPARRDKVKEEVISEEEDEEEGGDQEDDETDQTWSPLSDRSLVSGPSDSRGKSEVSIADFVIYDEANYT